MKKTILTAMAVLFTVSMAFAQMPGGQQGGGMPGGFPGGGPGGMGPGGGMPGPGGRPPMQMMQGDGADTKTMAIREAKKWKNVLELTQDQYDEVYKAYKKYFDGIMGSITMTEAGPQAPSEATINSYKKSLSKRMQKALNDVQFAQWEQMQAKEAERKDFQGHKPHGPRGEGFRPDFDPSKAPNFDPSKAPNFDPSKAPDFDPRNLPDSLKHQRPDFAPKAQ